MSTAYKVEAENIDGYQLERLLRSELLGQRIVRINAATGKDDGGTYHGFQLHLDNGYTVDVYAYGDECCASGWLYLQRLSEVEELDAVVTYVSGEIEYGKYSAPEYHYGSGTITIMAGMNEVLGFDCEWNEGSGYYCWGFNVAISRVEKG